MDNMIPAGINFQLWYKSNVSLGLIFQGFIHSMLCITKRIRVEIWKPDCSHWKTKRNKRYAWKFSKRAANFAHEKSKCKFKIRNWVQLEAHNHSKIDTRGEGNSKHTTLICTLVFKPQNQAGRVCNTSVDTSAYTRAWPIYQTNTGLYLPDIRQKWVWNPIPGHGMKVLKRIQYQEQAGMKIFTTPNTRIRVVSSKVGYQMVVNWCLQL